MFVRYSTVFHDSGVEWVYNGADIDGQQVVWARELDAASNSRLMKYFSDRQVWLVEPDEKPECGAGSDAAPVLVPYRDAPFRLMPFVALGAPGIPALEPSLVRSRMLEADAGKLLTCDQWNSRFSAVTGVDGPKLIPDCYGDDKNALVPFEKWWAWVQTMPRPTPPDQ